MAFDLYLAGGARKTTLAKLHTRGCCKLYTQLTDRRYVEQWINLNDEYNKKHPLFVDSGAFGAWTRGVDLDIDEYINYLNANTEYLNLFASIDKIPGRYDRPATLDERKQAPTTTWENYLYMRERIKDKDKLIVTFHLGEDFKILHNILETKLDGKYIPYIALGGTVGMGNTQKKKWYSAAFKIIKESSNPNVKIHAFGMTSTDLLELYPFTSADSTSWKMTGVYGYLLTEYGQVRISSKSANGDPSSYDNLTLKQKDRVLGWIKDWGLTYDEVTEDIDARAYLNAMFQLDWAEKYEYKGNNRYQKTLF